MEVTRGDPDRVDDQAIGEVLARYEERVPSGFVQKLESTRQDVQALRTENETMRETIAQRDLLLKDQSDELATQNRELAALQKKLDRLIGADERRARKEETAAGRRARARRATGVLAALALAAGAVLIWFPRRDRVGAAEGGHRLRWILPHGHGAGHRLREGRLLGGQGNRARGSDPGPFLWLVERRRRPQRSGLKASAHDPGEVAVRLRPTSAPEPDQVDGDLDLPPP